MGRLTNDTYTIDGQRYELNRHGFARRAQFEAAEKGEDRVVLRLTDSRETKAVYPWSFAFSVGYALEENVLAVTFSVENRDIEDLYFGLGAHPGFRVPLEEGKSFTDYRLTFGKSCKPWRVEMSDSYMISGRETPYPLEGGTVTLSAGPGTRGVRLSIPRMRYLGVWHTPGTDAPFVCLEPWVSLPSRQDVVEDFSQQSDLVTLSPGEIYTNRWTIEAF